MPFTPDDVNLNFSQESLWILNLCLAFIMYGVALDLKISDFLRVFSAPRSVIVGLGSQFILLPIMTVLLVLLMNPHPSLALGMILVAACPGGNTSNFISHMAKGNAALSVTITAFATVLASILTPLNFTFWGGILPGTASMLSNISLNLGDMIKTIILLIAFPLSIGLLFSHYLPVVTERIKKPVKYLSIIIFAGFLAIAFVNNYENFLKYIHFIIIIVFLHNGMAFLIGYLFGKLNRLPLADCKAISIETGIQNSGLALVLIFNFFDGNGGMALIAAWWGMWHLFAGMALATWWSRKTAFVQKEKE